MRGRTKPTAKVYGGRGGVDTSAESVAASERVLATKYGWQFKATKIVDRVKSRFGRAANQDVVAIHLSVSED